MTFQAVPNTVEAHIRCDMDGIPMENVFYFKRASAYNQGQLDALADAIDAWVDSDFMPLKSNLTTYVQTYVKGLSAAIDLQSTNTDNAGAVGVKPYAQANNVSKAITLRSGFTGRSARGRSFQFGMVGSDLSDTNTVTQAFVDDVIDALEALKVIIEALGWIWVIVSRYHNGVLRAEGLTTAVASFGVSNLTVDSQRNRLK